MEVTRPDGRALPPRPTLMVGDAHACQEAWARLYPQATQLLAQLPHHRTTSELELLEAALAGTGKAGTQAGTQTPIARARAAATGTAAAVPQPQPQPQQDDAVVVAAALGSTGMGHQLLTDLASHRQLVSQLAQLVPRLRSLRESLVSNLMTGTDLARQAEHKGGETGEETVHREQTERVLPVHPLLARFPFLDVLAGCGVGRFGQVYEVTCDVVVCAGREAASELLKGLNGLVTEIYPQIALRSTGPEGGESDRQGADDGTIACSVEGSVQGGGVTVPGGREGEIHAAHLLYFAVAPARPGPAERIAVLRGLVAQRTYWGHRAVQWALQVLGAYSRGDWAALSSMRVCLPCRWCGIECMKHKAAGGGLDSGSNQGRPCPGGCQPSCLLKEILDMRLGQVRLQALVACSASFRTLPWAVAGRFLVLEPLERMPFLSQEQSSGGDDAGCMLALAVPGPADEAWGDDDGAAQGVQGLGSVWEAQAGPKVDAQRVQGAEQLLALCGLLRQGCGRTIKGATVAWGALQTRLQDGCAGAGPLLVDVVFKT